MADTVVYVGLRRVRNLESITDNRVNTEATQH
jgi:hypothetical protein